MAPHSRRRFPSAFFCQVKLLSPNFFKKLAASLTQHLSRRLQSAVVAAGGAGWGLLCHATLYSIMGDSFIIDCISLIAAQGKEKSLSLSLSLSYNKIYIFVSWCILYGTELEREYAG